MMRVLLMLLGGPALALAVAWLLGGATLPLLVTAAIGGQVASYPIWRRLERRRLYRALRALREERRRRGRGVDFGVVRGTLSRGEVCLQLTLHTLLTIGFAVVCFLATR